MIVKPECIPCYLKQGLSTLRIAGLDDDRTSEVLYKAAAYISNLSINATPGENSSSILHHIYRIIGNSDPYADAKKQWNQFVMDEYENLIKLVEQSKDRLMTAFKISVAGNIIDMGITPDIDLDAAMGEITSKEFDYCDYDTFTEMLKDSRNILIVGDNCGEIVFDKILVKELKKLGMRVTYAVKREPILNDATMEDAEQVGMTGLCDVITNGNKFLGTVCSLCSEEFLTAYRNADIVIAKGQANFESLEGSAFAGEKTFFVLRAKCQQVADCLGVKLGEIALQRNKVRI